MTALVPTMARDGGMVAMVTEDGRTSELRCPIPGCRFRVRLTDLGELVETDVTEDQLRGHLAGHGRQEYLRAIADLMRERDGWQAAHDSVVEHMRVKLVRRCCALQAIEEAADALQRATGDSSPDDTWTAARAREHLAAVEADHGTGHEGSQG